MPSGDLSDKEFFEEHGYLLFPGLLKEDLPELLALCRDLASTTPEKLASKTNGDNDRAVQHWNSQGFLFADSDSGSGTADGGPKQKLYKLQAACVSAPEILDVVFRNEKVIEKTRQVLGLAGVNPSVEGGNSDTGTVLDWLGASYYPEWLRRLLGLNPIHSSTDGKPFTGSFDVFGTKFYPVWSQGGRSVSWHQDSHYFGTGPSQKIISCAMYLEDTDVENGCLQVIPGTHRAGKQWVHAAGSGEWAQGEWVALSAEERARVEDLECPAGSVVLFDARLLHAARANTSRDRTRLSMFGHFCPADLEFSWRGTDFARGTYSDRHSVV